MRIEGEDFEASIVLSYTDTIAWERNPRYRELIRQYAQDTATACEATCSVVGTYFQADGKRRFLYKVSV